MNWKELGTYVLVIIVAIIIADAIKTKVTDKLLAKF
jgi:ABC-type phosphate/phosphonate transport system permease subunit